MKCTCGNEMIYKTSFDITNRELKTVLECKNWGCEVAA